MKKTCLRIVLLILAVSIFFVSAACGKEPDVNEGDTGTDTSLNEESTSSTEDGTENTEKPENTDQREHLRVNTTWNFGYVGSHQNKLSAGAIMNGAEGYSYTDVFTIPKAGTTVTFGISPNGNNNTNFNSLFLDIEGVIKAECVDYICPQIYFGFEHGSLPYKSTVDQWSSYVKNSSVEIYIGLAAYKIGVSDQWAGTGKSEWTQSSNILKRQVEYLRSTGKCDGFMLYSYSSLFAPESSVAKHAEKEKNNLGSILK